MRFVLSLIFICTAASAAAQTGQLTVDAPIPADLRARDFLPSAAVAGVRDKMERVVGYWAFVTKEGKVEVTSGRPNSFTGTVPVVAKVTLGTGKPSYESVLTKSSEISAAIPVLGLSWAGNQRGQVVITDSAQFVAGGDPSITDWDSLPKSANGGHWVFIDSATVSIAQTTILTEKKGKLSALLGALSIGGSNYQALSGTQTSLIVALFLKRNPVDLAAAGTGDVKPVQVDATVKSFNTLSGSQ